MEIYVYKEGMSEEEQKNGAYFERNLLALLLCHYVNKLHAYVGSDGISGWYNDTDNNWEGWKRVISIENGRYTFHVPDSFDVGDLPEIKPNWDGHSTKEKWLRVFKLFDIQTDAEKKRREDIDKLVEGLRESLYNAFDFSVNYDFVHTRPFGAEVARTTVEVIYPNNFKKEEK